MRRQQLKNLIGTVVAFAVLIGFTALVIVGDGNGMVGVGYGKAKEVPAAIAKGVEEARKSFFHVPLIGGTVARPGQLFDVRGSPRRR